jgi:Hemerythrin HHE cation binding domain/Thioredoxin domain
MTFVAVVAAHEAVALAGVDAEVVKITDHAEIAAHGVMSTPGLVIDRTEREDPMQSLRTTSADHHAKLLPHVDRLLVLAEMVGTVECSAIHALFEDEYAFIVGQLVPHMEAIEGTLYDRLERLMGGRHSMAPMRQEHKAMAHLVEELGQYRGHIEGCSWSAVEGMALRRALYRLHSILKVHLAEEELYLGVLDQNLGDEEKDLLARGIDHAMAEPL